MRIIRRLASLALSGIGMIVICIGTALAVLGAATLEISQTIAPARQR